MARRGRGRVTSPQVAVERYIEGVRAGAQKYVEHAVRYGAPELQRFFSIALPAHENAWRTGQYRFVLATDADRIANVSQSWSVSRAASAQYRQVRVAAVAGVVPLV